MSGNDVGQGASERGDVVKKEGCLQYVLPFSYLSATERRHVEETLLLEEFEHGQTVIRQGEETQNSDLFIVRTGTFVALENGIKKLDFLLVPGSYFGTRSALFDSPSPFEIRAAKTGKAPSLWRLKHRVFLELLSKHNTPFALALASNLRVKQGMFDSFLGFRAFVFSSVHVPYGTSLNMAELIARFRKLKPAIHPLIERDDIVDYDGWSYALKRLPSNISSVYSIVCSTRMINVLKVRPMQGFTGVEIDELPKASRPSTPLAETETLITPDEMEYVVSHLSPGKPIATEERRRTCWEVMPGKLFVLLRELVSDYLDFITNLCVHTIESDKLRKLLRPISLVVPHIQRGLMNIQMGKDVKEVESKVFKAIDLDDRDVKGLQRLWPNHTLTRLLEVLIHHGDYSVYLDSKNSNYIISSDERWCNRVRSLATRLVGPFDIGEGSDLVVDILSSNTHSVLNCVAPYIHTNRAKIFQWGRENTTLFDEPFTNEMDRLYPIARAYFEANPEELKAARKLLASCGVEFLEEREVTGVSVQLYDINKLKQAGYGFDSGLSKACSEPMKHRRHLLVNIDYCFGSQGEQILRLLLLTFGAFVRSINILGKAGGLIGSRGDILYPTHVLDENEEGKMKPVENEDLDPEELAKLSGRDVHVGPIITVLGTVLQSRDLLKFYEKLWHATGMEMEASWYKAAIEEALLLGILPEDVKTRFLYYVSDTPLKPASSLAQKMSLVEGIPPLYSITRVLLDRVLDVSDVPQMLASEKEHVAKERDAADRWHTLRTVVRTAFSRPKKHVLRKTCTSCYEDAPME